MVVVRSCHLIRRFATDSIRQRSPHGIAGKGDRMVLIENMEKPKECQKCPFCNTDRDCPLIPYSNRIATFEEQYRDCPLIDVQT